jgi:argininosuccinate lyase
VLAAVAAVRHTHAFCQDSRHHEGQLERDADRLKAAFERTNRCPLGSCAITGTGFPIDRDLTADLLGFAGPSGNTYGSIATVDYLLEAVGAATVLVIGLGRFVQDLLVWCTSEFNYLRLSEGFVQVSSIMPQKRNPVALEHARAIASKAFGQAQAVAAAVHNTPFGDIVDTEDDLQPLVLSTFHDAIRAAKLVAAAMTGAEFDAARLEAAASEGWTTLTELADTLVQEAGVSFAAAHATAAALMAASARDPGRSLSDLFRRVASEQGVDGARLDYTDERLREILSPRRFVDVRRTLGGPAPSETARAIAVSRAQLTHDHDWLHERRQLLASAAERLSDRSRAL